MIDNLQLLKNNILISFPNPDFLTVEYISQQFKIAKEDLQSTNTNTHETIMSQLMSVFASSIGAVNVNTALVESTSSEITDVQKGDNLLCVDTQNNFMIGKSFDIDFNLGRVYFVTEFLPTKFNAIIK